MLPGPPVNCMVPPSHTGVEDALATAWRISSPSLLQLAEHPLAVVTVTEIIALPTPPAVQVIWSSPIATDVSPVATFRPTVGGIPSGICHRGMITGRVAHAFKAVIVQFGFGFTVTILLQLAEHPLLLVTVTPRVTVVPLPAVQVMVLIIR